MISVTEEAERAQTLPDPWDLNVKIGLISETKPMIALHHTDLLLRGEPGLKIEPGSVIVFRDGRSRLLLESELCCFAQHSQSKC